MMSDLPPAVRAEVQRILDGAARRLLAEAEAVSRGADLDPAAGSSDIETVGLAESTAPVAP